jgi:hypothetical protein
MSEKTEENIKNEQSRDTGKILDDPSIYDLFIYSW